MSDALALAALLLCSGGGETAIARTGATSSCLYRLDTPGSMQVLPLNGGVTQANIATTICVPGWTKTVRPSAGYIRIWKRLNLPAGADPKAYVVDHAEPLELGGASLAPNLRLQLKADARKKDREENALHAAVCAGRMTLRQAQERMAGDWPP